MNDAQSGHDDRRNIVGRTLHRVVNLSERQATLIIVSAVVLMHYQAEPQPDPKIVRCEHGTIFDVAVDLRPASPTYLKWTGSKLSADNGAALLIPVGCAHGFISLTDHSQVLYFMVTDRIKDFLRTTRSDEPFLVVDLDVVRDNFTRLARALPESRVFYAVKANPAPEILALLARLGSSFDAASLTEVEMVLAAGAGADRISFGNTIKKERDIECAYRLGVRMFAVDCPEEVEKVARVAPGSRVFCRILTDCEGAEWPLSRKFGCVPQMAISVLQHAHAPWYAPAS